jgi:hypothetical protein
MADTGFSAPGSSGSVAKLPFSPVDIDSFHADDKRAAAAIVGLMVGIFTLGLIGYFGVCLWIG